MVIQRGSSWSTAPIDNISLNHQEQPSNQHIVNHNTVYDTSSIRAPSVVTDPNGPITYNMVPSTTATDSEPQVVADWKNTFNMRRVTLANLASSQLTVRSTYKPHYPIHQVQERCTTTTAKSLDILRQNIQSAVNQELDMILKKYLEKFFQPAVDNIRSNLGSNSVSEDHVREVCRAILEEAKQMYCSSSQSRGSSPYNELSDSETSEYRFGRPYSNSPLFRKRKESDTDSEASQSVRRKRSRPRGQNQLGQPPVRAVRGEPIRREGPKWDPARITKETLFVMGARANKVLGFGQTRGRLYIKHPGLLRYSGDQEDKEWLSRHNLMPPTGGKAYLMVLSDIQELASMDEYRNNPNLLLHEMKGFEAPDFMLKKIREYVDTVRMDGVKIKTEDLCEEMMDSALLMVHPGGLGVDCVSSAMTPPATVLVDSGPPTPSDALDLLDCSSLAMRSGVGSPFLQHLTGHRATPNLLQHGASPTLSAAHFGLVSSCSPVDMGTVSHNTLSALLTGHMTSENSREGVE